MTANQIAYAQNVEAQRHNQTTEVETERHNKAMESLQDEANTINEEKNRITETYNYRMTDLQKQYNMWYEKFTEANEKEKRQIDWKLASIRDEQNYITQEHNRHMEEIGYQEADIKNRTLEETKAFNSFKKAQDLAWASMEWWFKEKGLDYQERVLEEQSSYHTGQLVNESTKEWHQWVLGQESNRIGWHNYFNGANKVLLDVNRLGLDATKAEADVKLGFAHAITSFMMGAGKLLEVGQKFMP